MAAKAAIEAGRIGDIRMIRVFGPNAGWDIPADSLELGSRPGVAVHGLGRPRLRHRPLARPAREATLAFAQFASYTDIPPTDQSSMAHYTLDGGVMVQIWLTYELPEPSLGSAMQLLITGSKGIIELDSYGTVRLGTPGRRAGRPSSSRRRSIRSTPTIRSGCRPTPRSSAT